MNKSELSFLLKQIRRFEKNLPIFHSPKIAVIGSSSVQYFVKILRYYLSQQGLNCELYEGEYNGVNMEIFDADSKLYHFNPDYVILLPYYEDIKTMPELLSDTDALKQCIHDTINYYQRIWEALYRIKSVRIIQSNIVIPPIKKLGNLEYQTESAECKYLRTINEELVKNKPSYVTLADADALSCNIGKYNWFDYPAYFLNKAGVRLEFMPEFVQLFVRQIMALQGNTKKCLVLDLDNTLWGGVVGDDGWDGIELDPNHAIGEAYRFFQQYVLSLKERGVILAICSKNNLDIAKEPFEKNEHMLIHLDDISCFVANWEDKAGNLKKIAQELNIGVDSLVFFDDNPAEREIVKQFAPEVYVVDVPEDPAQYVLQMEIESPFEWLQITKEDLERTNSYKDNHKRHNLQNSFIDYDEYLRALEMKGCAALLKEADRGRFTQLINKSNQFNLRTRRYSESDVQQMMADENTRCLYAKLSDKFSYYGLISCVILKKQEQVCFIDTWVMSCRVLKRGVEHMMFNAVIQNAADMGCSVIAAEYIKTKKNGLVQTFYESIGFEVTKMSEQEDGEHKQYILKDLKTKYTYFIKEEAADE